MNCLTARRILFARESTDSFSAQQHVAGCSLCKSFFVREDQFRTLVRSKIPATPASAQFREMILSKIAKERDKTSKKTFSNLRRRVSVVGAFLAIGLALVIYTLLRPTGPRDDASADQIVNMFIQDHIAGKVKEEPFDLVTSDKTRLERWFLARVDFNVTIPKLENTKLLGGRLCLMNGRRTVSLIFQKTETPITLYIADRSTVNFAALEASTSISNRSVYHANVKGCSIVLWEEKGLVYSLVSDLSEKELLGLVPQSS